ncbi:MAG: PAS domain S-box protein [Kaiparowitsia implicata GSE-PSE-MK54-09C]|jgi:PAS domain S-box-containing protein|nr:PAS domain S-box protein [Kaiparowitsia implicata GSE-PSE-MK54-09C]
MAFGLDQFEEFRQCCRDDAAFTRLCQLLQAMPHTATVAADQHQALLMAVPHLTLHLDADGTCLAVSRDPADYGVEHWVGQRLEAVLPPAVAVQWQVLIQQAQATGVLQTLDYHLPDPSLPDSSLLDSSPRHYQVRVAANGHQQVVAVVQDITQRKQAEADLRHSEDRLQGFFDATFEAVIIHNFHQVVDVNPAAERMFGYSYDEIVGMPVLELAQPASQQVIQAAWRSRQHPDDPYTYEAVGIRKDGSTFAGAVYAKPIQFHGQPMRVAGIRDITERKRAEATIRQSEARYRALIEGIPDMMFRIHRNGTYLDVKANHDQLLIPADELIGKSVYHVLPPDLAQQRMQAVAQALDTGQPQTFEYRVQLSSLRHQRHASANPSASPRHAEGSLLPSSGWRDYEARVVVSGEAEVVIIVRDITARILADAALRLSESKFATAFRSSPNPMTIATLAEGHMIEANDAFYETFGYSPEETLRHTVHELSFWVDPGDRTAMVQLLSQQGAVKNLEYQFRTRSGEVRLVLFSAEIIDIAGQPCLLDVIVDITERKQAEVRDRLVEQIALRIRESLELDQVLQTTVEEVRQVLNTDRVTIGHEVAGSLGLIVAESVESPWTPMLGLRFELPTHADYIQQVKQLFVDQGVKTIDDIDQVQGYEAIAQHYHEFQIRASLTVPITRDHQFFGLLVAHHCAGPRQWQAYEVELLEKLATQISIALQQAHLYQQVRDLNASLERKVEQRTAQLQQKNQELQELNDLKDEFLNAFSHDLRTPVMGISLVINNLLNQPGDTIPVSRSILSRMVQSNGHQLALIKSFLEAHSAETRGVHLQPELVQLSLLVQVIVEDLEPLVAKSRATLTNQVPPDLPLVTADPVQLRRVFENLVTNALHHNPPGVAITIEGEVEEDMIQIGLADNGAGMDAETCDRLFNRYSRGPNVGRHSTGIGLGLYLCQQIIIAHGGQIGVDSALGQGARFWFTLPLAIPAGANSPPPQDE